MSESKKCIDCGGVFPPMEPICTHCWDRYQSMSMRKSRHIAQLEVVKRAAEEFVNQSENVYWRGIEPQLGDAKTSIDMAYKNLKEALRGE